MADLRRLYFNIGFKGDDSGIKKMDTAADKMKKNVGNAGKAMSDSSKSAASKMKSDVGSVESSYKSKASGMLASMKDAFSGMQEKGKTALDGLKEKLDGVKNKSSGAKDGVMKIVKALGLVALASAGISMIKNSVSSAFDRLDTMAQFERTMTAITGNSESAGQALDALNDITKGTAYGLDVAAKATQDFVTRGMSVEDATNSVGAWADAVAFYGKGTNEELSNVSDAIAKMRTKGTVEMDQLNRLFDSGIDAVGMYAKANEMSSSEVQDALSKGQLSADDFLDSVENAMQTGAGGVLNVAGAAKEAGASWEGTFSNMKAAATRGMIKIVEAIDQALTDNGLPTLKDMIKEVGTKFEEVGGIIAPVIGTIIATVKEVIEVFKPWIPVIADIAEKIKDAFTNVVNFIDEAIGLEGVVGIVAGLAGAFVALKTAMAISGLIKGISTAYTILTGVMGALSIANITSIAESGILMGMYAADAIAKTASSVATGIMTAAQWALNTALTANPIGIIVMAIIGLIGLIVVLWNKNEGFRNAVIAVWDKIKEVLIGAWEAIKAVWEVVQPYFSAIWEGIKAVFSGVIEFYSGLFSGAWNIIVGIWNAAVGFFSGIITGIQSAFSGISETIKSAFTGAVEFVQGLPAKFLEWGKDMIQNMIDGIRAKITGVVDAVKEVGDKIKDFLGFSIPDEGVLSKSDEWMPHFMQNLSSGITDNMHLIKSAVSSLTAGMGMDINGTISQEESKNKAYRSAESFKAVNRTGAQNRTNNNSNSTIIKNEFKITVGAGSNGKEVVSSIEKEWLACMERYEKKLMLRNPQTS